MLEVLCGQWLDGVRRGELRAGRSLLTPGGQPLELGFSTRLASLSYTAEAGPVQAPVAERWRVVQAVADAAEARADPLLAHLAAQPRQRFGCWLGVRHRDAAPAFKLYQEVPDGCGDSALRSLHAAVPALAGVPGVEPSLVGVALGPGVGGGREFYCRVVDPDAGVLHRLLAAAGLARRLPAIVRSLSYLAGEQPDALWRRRIGMSFAVSPGAGTAVTVFAHGLQLFASNGEARARLLGLAAQLGDPLPLYERATRCLEGDTSRPMAHGMVGLKVGPDGELDCSVGVVPPALL